VLLTRARRRLAADHRTYVVELVRGMVQRRECKRDPRRPRFLNRDVFGMQLDLELAEQVVLTSQVERLDCRVDGLSVRPLQGDSSSAVQPSRARV
jgi:hypothetical protein